MTRLYLIRHGETEWNAIGRFQGWTDIPLSEKGLKQAELLGKRFEHGKIPVDAIYASPLIRAQQTAKPIAEATGLPVTLNEHFKEINYGEWDGMTFQELKATYGADFMRFMKEPHKFTFPGDGSFELVTERVKLGLQEVLGEANKGKNIVLVSHGGIIRLTLFYLMGISPGLYNHFWIDNTGISIYEIWDNGRRVLKTLNDSSHLIGV